MPYPHTSNPAQEVFFITPFRGSYREILAAFREAAGPEFLIDTLESAEAGVNLNSALRNRINSATAIVADLSPTLDEGRLLFNPNVFYELGRAH